MNNSVKRLVGATKRSFGNAFRSGKKVWGRAVLQLKQPGAEPKNRGRRSAEGTESQPAAASPDLPEKPVAKTSTAEDGGRRSAPVRQTRKKKRAWSLADFPVDPLPGRSRFHDFSIDERIMRGIASEDFKYCTPVQEQALPAALSGKDLVARAQTGTGKTAVFLIALCCKLLADRDKWPPPGHPRALIIAPTRELVIQIAKDAKKLAAFSTLNTLAVFGGTDYRKQEELLEGKRIDIIAATPGRLLDFIRQRKIDLDHCTILVIDEADRMLDMGFIPDVRRIVSRLPGREQRQTMLFSATISDDVRRLADQWCNRPQAIEAGEDTVDVERIEQRIYLTTGEEKYTLLYNLATSSPDARILVFTNMKSEAAGLAKRLAAHGLECQLLTGDVPQQKRLARLEAFRSGKKRLLIATDVAGRGIHIDDIDYVVNYTLPYEPEDYVHRIGRTGRAGADGVAVSFACEKGSFYLPAIEEFLGRRLSCMPPEESLLEPLPEPAATKASSPSAEPPEKRGGSSRRRRPRRRSRSKSGG